MRILRKMSVGLVAGPMLLFGALGAQSASAQTPNMGQLVCTGGPIAPGTYLSVTVTGFCTMSGTVTILGNLYVNQNGALDAATLMPVVTIDGSIAVGKNAVLELGCSPELSCPGVTSDIVHGNVVSTLALSVILHNNTIGGSMNVTGGGGGVNCNPLLFGGPAYDDFEDNVIGGSVNILGVQSCYLGFLRNTITGTVVLGSNIFADPDAMEIVTNTIGGNLNCFGNSPAPQIGDSGGVPNIVGGAKLGQCTAV